MNRKLSDNQMLQHLKKCPEGIKMFKKIATANKLLTHDDFQTPMSMYGFSGLYTLEDLVHNGYVIEKVTRISFNDELNEFSISEKGKRLYNEFCERNDSRNYLKEIEDIIANSPHNYDTLQATIELLLKAWKHSMSHKHYADLQNRLKPLYNYTTRDII